MSRYWVVRGTHCAIRFDCRSRARGFAMILRAKGEFLRIEFASA